MHLSSIHFILFITRYQLVDGDDNNNIPSKLISKNSNDQRFPTVTNDQENQTQNGSFNVMVRLIAFGIQRTDDEQQKLTDPDSSKFILSSNKDPDGSEDEETEKLQQDTRLLLLPLMIRILLERANTSWQSNSYEINYRLNTSKLLTMEQTNFSESVKRLISITIDAVKIEKTTMVVFLILGIAIFFFTILSILRRLRHTHKLRIIRVGSNCKKDHEETKKLLP